MILCVRNAPTTPHVSNLVTRQMCSLFTAARQNWMQQKLSPWFEQKSLRVLVKLPALTIGTKRCVKYAVKQMCKCVKLHNSKVHISGSQLTSPDLTIKANFKFISVQSVDHLVRFILERNQ